MWDVYLSIISKEQVHMFQSVFSAKNKRLHRETEAEGYGVKDNKRMLFWFYISWKVKKKRREPYNWPRKGNSVDSLCMTISNSHTANLGGVRVHSPHSNSVVLQCTISSSWYSLWLFCPWRLMPDTGHWELQQQSWCHLRAPTGWRRNGGWPGGHCPSSLQQAPSTTWWFGLHCLTPGTWPTTWSMDQCGYIPIIGQHYWDCFTLKWWCQEDGASGNHIQLIKTTIKVYIKQA